MAKVAQAEQAPQLTPRKLAKECRLGWTCIQSTQLYPPSAGLPPDHWSPTAQFSIIIAALLPHSLPAMDTAQVEETVKRLSSHKGVQGVLVVNGDGVPIRSTLAEHELSVQYAALVTQLAGKARAAVRELAKEPGDDLHSLRIRSKKHGGRGGMQRREGWKCTTRRCSYWNRRQSGWVILLHHGTKRAVPAHAS